MIYRALKYEIDLIKSTVKHQRLKERKESTEAEKSLDRNSEGISMNRKQSLLSDRFRKHYPQSF